MTACWMFLSMSCSWRVRAAVDLPTPERPLINRTWERIGPTVLAGRSFTQGCPGGGSLSGMLPK